MTEINPIGPLKGSDDIQKSKNAKPASSGKTDFKDTLKEYLKDVDAIKSKADKSIEKMTSGEINNVHQAVDSVHEADQAFNMMMEIKNKVQDAYQEVMRMRH